ncbi:hypothetical protein [uncultured Pontibacter sp.]|uniref:hypothetical protein n=1 Tax=uncultured Pontibacter sp. TaxID=453356 RepID=UPI00261D8FC0|nr:hypothetical protein [uncultured Pontibacter sp.]
MAEINIERKKKSVWPWLLLILLVALLIWAIYELTNDNDTVNTGNVSVAGMIITSEDLQQLPYPVIV